MKMQAFGVGPQNLLSLSEHIHQHVIASFTAAFAPPNKQLTAVRQRWLGEKARRIETQILLTKPVSSINPNPGLMVVRGRARHDLEGQRVHAVERRGSPTAAESEG